MRREEDPMRISSLLHTKGSFVATIEPGASVADVIDRLAEHGIGALVVSEDGEHITGIVSERDVVRRLRVDGVRVLDAKVDDIMTAEVHTCAPDAEVDSLMALMTDHRVRHVPVVVDGKLAGIVSIGDVVKQRIGELERENGALVEYITTGR
jgi:CBS domain-containing protein